MEALATHTTKAAEKLRAHGLVAGRLRAFYHTYAYRTSKPQHSVSRVTSLMPMTNDTLELVAAARRCAEAGWIDGHPFEYGKVGVMLEELVRDAERPRTLFETPQFETAQNGSRRERNSRLMEAMDGVNAHFGRKTLTHLRAPARPASARPSGIRRRRSTARATRPAWRTCRPYDRTGWR